MNLSLYKKGLVYKLLTAAQYPECRCKGVIKAERGKTMKTRALKKVLSVICVIAMLMSLCVVGLVGVSSAAENEYTLYHNGTVTQVTLAEGADLPNPGPYKGARFLGWYDETFTNEYKTVGAKTTLYAKYSAAIFDFELDASHYAHANTAVNYTYGVTDPTDASNKVAKYTIGPNQYMAIPITEGATKLYEFKAGVEYTVYFKYYGVNTTGPVTLRVYNAKPDVVDKTFSALQNDEAHRYIRPTEASAPYLRPAPYPPYDNWIEMTPLSGKWSTFKMKVAFTQEDIDAGRTALILHMQRNDTGDAMLFDDLIVVEDAVEVNVTLNNADSVTTEKYIEGSELPKSNDPNFTGWYDETFTYKYEFAPDTDVELYAKYKKVFDTFESESKVFDPNNKFPADNGFKIVVDPSDAKNHVLSAPISSAVVDNYAIRGAEGIDAGYTVVRGSLCTVKLRYKASGIGASGAKIYFKTVDNASIGKGADIGLLAGWEIALENTDDWKDIALNVILSNESTIDLTTLKNLVMAVVGGADSNGTVLIDNFSIGPYAPPVDPDSAEIEMDFEAEGGFKWSVPDANKYNKTEGNGYVNRGELITEDDNTFFRVSHFKKKGAYIYFTIDDGLRQFNVADRGIYTIEFDYKVHHSETKSSIGLVFVKPTTADTGMLFSNPVVEFDSFSTDNVTERDDKDWTHVTYTFGADLSAYEGYTSIGLYVFNDTGVPEINPDFNKLTATVVDFDNITVKTNSECIGDGMIIFDSIDGSECAPLIAPSGEPIGALPEPTKYGYEFDGWKYDTEAGAMAITSNTVMPGFITNAYATWKLAPGVVDFRIHTNVPEYDAKYKSIIAFPGKPVTTLPLEEPTMPGQVFAGWYYDSAFTKPVSGKNAPAESGDIYAMWGKAPFICDFEDYTPIKANARAKYVTDEDTGNNYLDWWDGWVPDTSNVKGVTSNYYNSFIHNGNKRFQVFSGSEYKVTFKYKLLEGEIKVRGLTGDFNAQWANRKDQTNGPNPEVVLNKVDPDNWHTATFTFVAALNDPAHNFLGLGIQGLGHIYIDDISIECEINSNNIYGSVIVLDTNGGKTITHVSGEVGSKIVLPTPVRSGYKFVGWYTDKTFTAKFTETTYTEQTLSAVARWQLGKYVEDFEELPNVVMTLAVDPAYTLYDNKVAGFDKSNVHSGVTALFRKGNSAGLKAFTTARTSDLQLNVGDEYTLTMYVKPTAISDAAGTINMINMASYTGINSPSATNVIAKMADLKVGEWNKITYTFTAASKYVGINTTAGNDMYIDDVTVTLKGYSGSANTGDSSVNPFVIVALVVLCAGALLITGKKVFSK